MKPDSDSIFFIFFTFLSSWLELQLELKSWWWHWAGSMSAFFSEENKVTWPSAAQPKTSFNMDDSVAGEAAPPPTTTTAIIQPLATERTRGDAIYSDRAFEICMPHAARLPQRLLCVFSEDVTATGRRLEEKKTTSHRCIFSVILLRHWHSSTW